MKKIKLSDMSYKDKKTYQYYKRVLGDLETYGEHYLKETATRRIKHIEEKYKDDDE